MLWPLTQFRIVEFFTVYYKYNQWIFANFNNDFAIGLIKCGLQLTVDEQVGPILIRGGIEWFLLDAAYLLRWSNTWRQFDFKSVNYFSI